MTYIVKVSYFDQESDREEYGTREEAEEIYSDTIDQIGQLGSAFGDVARVALIAHRADKYTLVRARDYE